MRSSSGAHFIALDHVRALASFMVFAWHFNYIGNGNPALFHYAPALFPLSIIDEGHTGVALFMTLSGYLFAKLLDGKSINYGSFLQNRALRLLPLLVVVILINAGITLFHHGNLLAYFMLVLEGVALPTLPSGGWSITVEAHFYLVLPLFLWLLRKSMWAPLSLVATALALRALLYLHQGEIQPLAYWTIIGRVDQFALGMLVFQFRDRIAHRHVLAGTVIITFMAFYWYFDAVGGFSNFPSYPSPSLIWIFLPTIEAVAYAVAICWYDTSFVPRTTGVSKFVGLLGTYSYSIYLLHSFVVFDAARFIHENIMDLTNFYRACVWALICFVLMIIPGYLSFRFIESPFLKLRKRYTHAWPESPAIRHVRPGPRPDSGPGRSPIRWQPERRALPRKSVSPTDVHPDIAFYYFRR